MESKQRLIDANLMRDDWLENGENEYIYDTNAVLASIDEQPTVDAVEVVHGRWIEHIEIGAMNNHYECSACHWKTPFFTIAKNSNYCPNCGARMDGVK